MFKYAQIDILTGRCISVSFLSGEVEADNMIPLTDEDSVNLNDTYDNGTWIPAPLPEPIDQGPSELDIIGQQLVEKDLQILDLQSQNNLLGQQMVDIDLRLLQGGL